MQITEIIISNDSISGTWTGRPSLEGVDSHIYGHLFLAKIPVPFNGERKGRSFQWVVLEQLDINMEDKRETLAPSV